MTSPVTKRSDLATFCVGALTARKSGLKHDDTYRGADEAGVSRADRVRVMGDPVYYLEILHTVGPLTSPSPGAIVSGGKMSLSIDTFRVSLWLEQSKDGSTSQSVFDNLLHAQTAGEEGLIYKLSQTLRIGSSVRFSMPREPVEDVVWMGTDQARAHYATFTIDLEG